MRKAPCVKQGAFHLRSPDGVRTRATALRGRRARPLHNGAVEAVTILEKYRDYRILQPRRLRELGYQDSNLE